MDPNLSKNLKVLAGKLARECPAKTPLEWMLEPLQIFLFNWECVEASLVAEADAAKDAQKHASKKQPEIDCSLYIFLISFFIYC